nr:hypothetical protein [Rhodococcus sp. (in: high G+C Gram-positive bacteria)]
MTSLMAIVDTLLGRARLDFPKAAYEIHLPAAESLLVPRGYRSGALTSGARVTYVKVR